MIFYLAWSAASVLWSINPGMSCRRLAVLMFCVLGAAGFARQFRPRDLALMAMVISGVYLLVGVGGGGRAGHVPPLVGRLSLCRHGPPQYAGRHLAVLCLASFCLARSAGRGGNVALDVCSPWGWSFCC